MRKIRLNPDIIINAVIALNILSLNSDLIIDYFYFTDYLPQPLLIIGYTLAFYTVFGMFWSILIAVTAAVSQIIKKHRTSQIRSKRSTAHPAHIRASVLVAFLV